MTQDTNTRAAQLEADLRLALRYLADLNGCAWIPGNSPGEIDMRQRAKALQERLANTLREK